MFKKWELICVDNKPSLIWTEMGLGFVFCWDHEFRGLKIVVGPIHIYLGFWYIPKSLRLR